MSLVCEIGATQLVKHGEITCGDSYEVVRNPEETVVVLSDGLGSGVKANILSNLTTKIISKMVSSHVPMQDIVETIIGTLPVCSVRGVAYSTFTILKITPDNQLEIIDFDGLPPILVRNGFVEVVDRVSQDILGKQINWAKLQLQEDDYLLITSDGVTEAGLGLTLPMGLQTSGLVKALKENVKLNNSAQDLVDQVIGICMSYYIDKPGDDTTAVALHMREARECAVMTGLPVDKNDDARMVSDFLKLKGRKIICGGSTAQAFARETGRTLESVDSEPLTDSVPPISHISGIDLVTEGIITMDACCKYLQSGDESVQADNGATMLMEQFLYADRITFLVGTQLNPAYAKIKAGIHLRDAVIQELSSILRERGKEVVVIPY